MGFVFKIYEELAVISVTATELLAVTGSIMELVKNESFLDQFSEIVAEINLSYGVLLDSFTPFYALSSEELFVQRFDDTFEAFKSRYLLDVSKPRKYCDNVYDAYIGLQKTKEAKSTFPALKRSFSRLDALYDKWITNDALLAMSIDGALKLKNRLLNEIADIKAKDEEEAFIVFSSAFEDFRDYITLIQKKSASVSSIVRPD